MLDLDCFSDFANSWGRIKVTDIRMSSHEYTTVEGILIPSGHYNCRCFLGATYDPIDRVIFHDPATIIYWKDGSKTVVKCGPNDTFDAEKGLAMAIAKKFLGNKGNYNNIIKKYLKECANE